MYKMRAQFNLRPSVKYGFDCTELQRNSYVFIGITELSSMPNFNKLIKKYGQYKQKFIFGLK